MNEHASLNGASSPIANAWKDAVTHARSMGVAADNIALTVVRASTAHEVEGAHEMAVIAARALRDSANSVLASLERDGIGASLGGIPFHSRAGDLAEAIVTLRLRREQLVQVNRITGGK